jgi:pimeloyl-ACP methyl ester carboxylesterase
MQKCRAGRSAIRPAPLAQVVRDVRGAVIPASGHNIALENPAALAEAYLDFFAGG